MCNNSKRTYLHAVHVRVHVQHHKISYTANTFGDRKNTSGSTLYFRKYLRTKVIHVYAVARPSVYTTVLLYTYGIFEGTRHVLILKYFMYNYNFTLRVHVYTYSCNLLYCTSTRKQDYFCKP